MLPSWARRKGPDVRTKVVIDNAASPVYTVVDVYARDHMGLLYAIAHTLHEEGLSIALSKVNTEGLKAADVFYVERAEGGGVISEGLAWYSAMQLVKHVKGREALRRFMATMREPNPWPPIRTGLPLLRAMDPWANYRKGPYAMYALSEYVGEERVNGALRTLLQKQAGAATTTLDLYRELQAATPDSLQYLLHDLFAANTFWELDAEQATARRILEDGNYLAEADKIDPFDPMGLGVAFFGSLPMPILRTVTLRTPFSSR